MRIYKSILYGLITTWTEKALLTEIVASPFTNHVVPGDPKKTSRAKSHIVS